MLLNVVIVALFLSGAFGFRARPSRRPVRILFLSLSFFLALLKLNLAFRASLLVNKSTKSPPPRVFLLSGQSNMAGRGGLVRKGAEVRKVFDPHMLSTSFERDLTVADQHVVRLTASDVWVPATEPLHHDIDVNKSCGIGPGLIFARLLGGPVSLIPCAVGGTKIDEWAPETALYQTMIRRALLNPDLPLDALLWYQGESDGLVLEDAQVYFSKLKRFRDSVRRDLRQPHLRIIMVAIWADLSRCPYREMIREAIFSLAREDKFLRVVDAQHAMLQDDKIHLTSQAQWLLAEKFVREFNSLLL